MLSSIRQKSSFYKYNRLMTNSQVKEIQLTFNEYHCNQYMLTCFRSFCFREILTLVYEIVFPGRYILTNIFFVIVRRDVWVFTKYTPGKHVNNGYGHINLFFGQLLRLNMFVERFSIGQWTTVSHTIAKIMTI